MGNNYLLLTDDGITALASAIVGYPVKITKNGFYIGLNKKQKIKIIGKKENGGKVAIRRFK